MLNLIKSTFLKPILLEILNDIEIRTAFQNFFKNNDSSKTNIHLATNTETEKITELEKQIKDKSDELQKLQSSLQKISAEKMELEKHLQDENTALKNELGNLKNTISKTSKLMNFGIQNALITFDDYFANLDELTQIYAFINKISQWQTILDIHQNLESMCEKNHRAVNNTELNFLQRCIDFYNMNFHNKTSLFTAEVNEYYDYDLHKRSKKNTIGDIIEKIMLPGLKNANGDIIYPVLVVTK